MRNHSPILVTGAHRTGTSWVGKMLCAGGEAAYISEPLNVWHRPGVFGAAVGRWYTYISRENEHLYLPAFQQTLRFRYRFLAEIGALRSRKDFLRMGRDAGIFLRGRIFNQRPLLKDPFAVFSIPWFVERLNCRVVVTLRHPAAFASSLKRLDWNFDMEDLLAQPLLMHNELGDFEGEMRAVMANPSDIIGQASLLWRMVYHCVDQFRKRGYPILLVRHEDLSLQPVEGFRDLYRELGLDFSKKAEQAVLTSSSADNPKELAREKRHSVRLDSRSNLANWRKRLHPDEILRVRELTQGVAELFYGAETWDEHIPSDSHTAGGVQISTASVKREEEQPLVSIVTPSFNQAPFLEETILSVLNQDYPNIEYLIVDGGSTDGSLEIIRRYADKLAWWVSEKDQGQTDAINKGFARARGSILAWINSDDTYLPHAVSEAVAFLREHPQVGMVYGDANFIDESGRVVGKFPARQTDYRRLRQGYVHIPQQAAFFRAELWRKVAPLDPSFFFAMDYDLWVRLAKIAPLVYTPRLWANFRLHGSGKTIAADDRCWPEMLRVHYREGGAWLSPIGIKSVVRRLAAPYINWTRRRMINKFRT